MEWVLRIMANLLRPDEIGPAEAVYRTLAVAGRAVAPDAHDRPRHRAPHLPAGRTGELARRHRRRGPVRRRRRRGRRPPQPRRNRRAAARSTAPAGAAPCRCRCSWVDDAPARPPRRPDSRRRAGGRGRGRGPARDRHQGHGRGRRRARARCARPARDRPGAALVAAHADRPVRTCGRCPTPRSRCCATPSTPRRHDRLLADAAAIGARAVSAHQDVVTPAFIAAAAERGLAVYCWYQSLEVQQARLAEVAAAGLAGVVTDWPAAAREASTRTNVCGRLSADAVRDRANPHARVPGRGSHTSCARSV